MKSYPIGVPHAPIRYLWVNNHRVSSMLYMSRHCVVEKLDIHTCFTNLMKLHGKIQTKNGELIKDLGFHCINNDGCVEIFRAIIWNLTFLYNV